MKTNVARVATDETVRKARRREYARRRVQKNSLAKGMNFPRLNRMKILLEHESNPVGAVILAKDSQGTVNAPEVVATRAEGAVAKTCRPKIGFEFLRPFSWLRTIPGSSYVVSERRRSLGEREGGRRIKRQKVLIAFPSQLVLLLDGVRHSTVNLRPFVCPPSNTPLHHL